MFFLDVEGDRERSGRHDGEGLDGSHNVRDFFFESALYCLLGLVGLLFKTSTERAPLRRDAAKFAGGT